MSHQQQDDNDSTNKGQKKFLEILGDTIVPNQLLLAIIISVVISLGGYNIGLRIFPSFASENMVASYSLLLGIVGTVLSLVLCSILFKPKRILLEEETSSESMREFLKICNWILYEELRLIENDPITKKELEELGVLKAFLST